MPERAVCRERAALHGGLILPAASALLMMLFGPSYAGTNCSYDATTGKTTCVYVSAGLEQRFPVPAGVTSVHVVARGAPGGTLPGSANGAGGRAAEVSGDLAVTPGSTLFVEVGGAAFNDGGCGTLAPCESGFNGGGRGGDFGAGGGGASDVRTVSIGADPSPGGPASLASRLLVAAGGGGGGTNRSGCQGGAGGDAGSAGGAGAYCGPSGSSVVGGTGGGGGTSSGGGTAGNPSGDAGDIGIGGSATVGIGGSGGGGGLYGGGAGGDFNSMLYGSAGCPADGSSSDCTGAAGGGGGGSNLVPSGGTSGLTSDPPRIAISYVLVTDQLTNLLAAVTAVPPGKSLADKVRKIQAYVAANNIAGACSLLADLVKQITALAPKKISATTAASLIAKAGFVQTSLGCPGAAAAAMLANSPNAESAPIGFGLEVRKVSAHEMAIEYSLPSESFVSVGVYDVAGRRVATIASGPREAGTHQATWNSSAFTRGVYFVRITAGGQAIARTVLNLP